MNMLDLDPSIELQTYTINESTLSTSISHGDVFPNGKEPANFESIALLPLPLDKVENQTDDDIPLLPRKTRYIRSASSSQLTENVEHGATVASAVFNLSTTIIGAGIMALPATMKVLGLPLGVLLILAMGWLSEVSLEFIIYFSTKMKAWFYADMVYNVCGWAGKLVAQICVIVNNAGIVIVYLIIIGDVISGSPNHTGLLEEWTGRNGWWSSRQLVLFLTMVLVLAPLSSLKRIDSLQFTSALSVALAVVFVFLCAGIAVVKACQGSLQRPRLLPSFKSQKEWLDLFIVIPIMTNAFICHFNIQPIYYELQNKSELKMRKVGRISMTLCVLVYTTTAISGYLLFGESTASDVLSNFDQDLGIAHSISINNVIRIGYIIHLMLVFPVINFSLRQTVDTLLFPNATPLYQSNRRFYLLTLSLLSVVLLGSTAIPNIWIAFQFTGATAGLSLGFIFPALIALRSKDKVKKIQTWAWLMLILAVISSLLGVATNIYNVAFHNTG